MSPHRRYITKWVIILSVLIAVAISSLGLLVYCNRIPQDPRHYDATVCATGLFVSEEAARQAGCR